MSWPFVSVDSPLIGAFWPDYPADEDALQALLDAAHGQCDAFAPAAPDRAPRAMSPITDRS